MQYLGPALTNGEGGDAFADVDGLTRFMLRQALRNAAADAALFGTPNGWADEFADAAGVDLGASDGVAISSGRASQATSTPGPLATMTSNSAPSGEAAWGNGNGGTSFDYYKAFDNSGSSGWKSASAGGGVFNWQLGRTTATQRRVVSYSIEIASGTTVAPRDWTLRGSNDDPALNNWTTLDTRTGQTWSASETKSFDIAAPQAFQHYLLVVTAVAAGFSGQTTVQELELVAADLAGAFDLVSIARPALVVPDRASLIVVAKAGVTLTPGENLLGYVSRDDGTTWVEAALIAREAVAGGYTRYEALNIDLSAAPSGTAMRYRIATDDAADALDVAGAATFWN